MRETWDSSSRSSQVPEQTYFLSEICVPDKLARAVVVSHFHESLPREMEQHHPEFSKFVLLFEKVV